MKEKKFFVYEHVNKINGKKYVGITSRAKPEDRWGSNGVNYKECTYFYSAIEKYGWDGFNHNILYSNLSKDDACKIEMQLIESQQLQNREYGYNLKEGGTVAKMPKEICEKISKAMIGNKNNLGRIFNEETRRKISENQKGKIFTEEHKRRISEAKKGKTHKPISEESRKKISDAYPNKRKVYCVETDKVYNSTHECARELGLTSTNIVKVCKGKFKSTKGYHLNYYDN